MAHLSKSIQAGRQKSSEDDTEKKKLASGNPETL
jgi:hypothetical protein